MGIFDRNRSGVGNAPMASNPDGVEIASPVRKGKLDAVRTLMFWVLSVTFIVIVVVMLFSFLFVLVRGGTLPSIEIFTTIVKVIGNVLMSLLGGE